MDPAWHDCFFYNAGCEDYNGCSNYKCEEEGVDEPEEPTEPVLENTVSFMDWLDCYRNTDGSAEECGDLNGSYNRCYWSEECEGIADPAWHDCFWYGTGCLEYNGCSSYTCEDEGEGTDSGESPASFLEWLSCYESTREECGDESGAYYSCYMYEACEGIVN